MSEKPQAARADGQEDLLEQIFTQGLKKIPAPPQTNDGQDASADGTTPLSSDREDSKRAANRRNRRSAVYLYLLVLFGAAFLMLLLAYFIQRRSSEDTISDLRDSMNLSRAELLVQIKDLEAENEELSGEVDRLNGDLLQWQQRYEEKSQEAVDFFDSYSSAQEELYAWASFWMLENYYQLGNLDACAAVLLMQEQGQYTYRTPDRARQAEIIQAVVDAGILDEQYAQHPEDYRDLLTAYSQP